MNINISKETMTFQSAHNSVTGHTISVNDKEYALVSHLDYNYIYKIKDKHMHIIDVLEITDGSHRSRSSKFADFIHDEIVPKLTGGVDV